MRKSKQVFSFLFCFLRHKAKDETETETDKGKKKQNERERKRKKQSIETERSVMFNSTQIWKRKKKRRRAVFVKYINAETTRRKRKILKDGLC